MQYRLFARGRHSKIYLTDRGTIIKKFEPKFLLNYKKECFFLKLLSKYSYVPTLIGCNDDRLEIEREFIDCPTLEEYLENSEKILNILMKIMEICFSLDKIGIQKEEMHRPIKHIFVCENRIVFIDWERARLTKKPNNLLQFVEYLYSRRKLLEKRGIVLPDREKIIDLLKKYKKKYSEEAFKGILKALFDPPG